MGEEAIYFSWPVKTQDSLGSLTWELSLHGSLLLGLNSLHSGQGCSLSRPETLPEKVSHLDVSYFRWHLS